MPGLLPDKVAIITGGTSGIGLATVNRYVDDRAKVVIADIQDDNGKEIADGLGESALYAHIDVTDEAAIEAAVNTTVEHFGKLDIMYNNADAQGIPARSPMGESGTPRTSPRSRRSWPVISRST